LNRYKIEKNYLTLIRLVNKKSPYIAVKAFKAPPLGESYNFNAMVIYLTIRKTMA
jgi:hypothetical protein